MKTKKTYRYMHTLFGRPAYYHPEHQICFASGVVEHLAKSLKQIRAEVKASDQYRKQHGLTFDLLSKHHYARVRIR